MPSRPVATRLLAAAASVSLLLPACGRDDGAGVRTIEDGGSASGSGSGSASGTEASGSATTDG
ncbi:MAG: hypothetical protein GEU74_06920 [Nitriliruptorales bacterium]|nr:hypothetical protein [Nitriliruptorales bacterium]